MPHRGGARVRGGVPRDRAREAALTPRGLLDRLVQDGLVADREAVETALAERAADLTARALPWFGQVTIVALLLIAATAIAVAVFTAAGLLGIPDDLGAPLFLAFGLVSTLTGVGLRTARTPWQVHAPAAQGLVIVGRVAYWAGLGVTTSGNPLLLPLGALVYEVFVTIVFTDRAGRALSAALAPLFLAYTADSVLSGSGGFAAACVGAAVLVGWGMRDSVVASRLFPAAAPVAYGSVVGLAFAGMNAWSSTPSGAWGPGLVLGLGAAVAAFLGVFRSQVDHAPAISGIAGIGVGLVGALAWSDPYVAPFVALTVLAAWWADRVLLGLSAVGLLVFGAGWVARMDLQPWATGGAFLLAGAVLASAAVAINGLGRGLVGVRAPDRHGLAALGGLALVGSALGAIEAPLDLAAQDAPVVRLEATAYSRPMAGAASVVAHLEVAGVPFSGPVDVVVAVAPDGRARVVRIDEGGPVSPGELVMTGQAAYDRVVFAGYVPVTPSAYVPVALVDVRVLPRGRFVFERAFAEDGTPLGPPRPSW